MNYYTSTIPPTLAEKLKEKGMPIETEGDNIWCPPYAEVFDWLMSEKNIHINVFRIYLLWEAVIKRWDAPLKREEKIEYAEERTWHEAANAAIEKALALI